MLARQVVGGVKEMHALAGRVARDVKPGDVLLLEGELGSGKTTFVQGLARTLGVKDKVTSPTYIIGVEYEAEGERGIRRLVHIDLYRLSEEEAGKEAAVKEMLDSADEGGRVTVVEWADRLGQNVPAGAKEIIFGHGERENERVVEVKNPNDPTFA